MKPMIIKTFSTLSLRWEPSLRGKSSIAVERGSALSYSNLAAYAHRLLFVLGKAVAEKQETRVPSKRKPELQFSSLEPNAYRFL